MNTFAKAADMGTCAGSVKKPISHVFWIGGPEYLWEPDIKSYFLSAVAVNKIGATGEVLDNKLNDFGINRLIESQPICTL